MFANSQSEPRGARTLDRPSRLRPTDRSIMYVPPPVDSLTSGPGAASAPSGSMTLCGASEGSVDQQVVCKVADWCSRRASPHVSRTSRFMLSSWGDPCFGVVPNELRTNVREHPCVREQLNQDEISRTEHEPNTNEQCSRTVREPGSEHRPLHYMYM